MIQLYLENKESETLFHILNMETINMDDLERLKEFARTRGGFFRQDLKLFSVRKKWTKITAKQIFALLNIAVQFVEKNTENCHDITEKKENSVQKKNKSVIGFGKHKGMFWSELPLNYLEWLAKNLPTNHHDMQIIHETILSKNK